MSISILLADDHTVVRDGLAYLLNAQPDLQVIGLASDGEEAVRQAEILKPDIIVMDIAMPGLNGIEATRQIKDACPSCKIVILSMLSTSEHFYRAFQAGAHGYLLKESAGKEVAEAVKAVYEGGYYVSTKLAAFAEEYDRKRQTGLPKSPLESLSRREHEVLQLVTEGNSSVEIAARLALSPKTVETYRSRLMKKLKISDLAGLVKFAIQNGLTPLS